MRYYYYAVDEFGDKMRKFLNRNYAKQFVSQRDGWTIEKEERIVKPIIDWNNYEPALF